MIEVDTISCFNYNFGLIFDQVQAHSKSILQKAIPDLTRPVLELRIAYCLALEDILRIEGNKFVLVSGFLIQILF